VTLRRPAPPHIVDRRGRALCKYGAASGTQGVQQRAHALMFRVAVNPMLLYTQPQESEGSCVVLVLNGSRRPSTEEIRETSGILTNGI